MSRSTKKGPYVDQKLLKMQKLNETGDKKVINGQEHVITPDFTNIQLHT